MCKPSYLKKIIHVSLAAVSVSLCQPTFADDDQCYRHNQANNSKNMSLVGQEKTEEINLNRSY
ncbi:MAG TPA: hypothetical protein VNJ29_02760 [Candidatus Nitrosotenuis sp.]|jgi:hypothetical protein|nr:hypothetical protein [Candidatus Nitrosotenuis sp.]